MIGLAPLKSHLAQHLPNLAADKCHLIIVNGTFAEGYMDYTARLLLLDYRGDPIHVLTVIRSWLEQHNRHKDKADKDISLSFSSEVIDTDTFDLEVDFPQSEKVVFNNDGYHICSDPIWDDDLGKFVSPGD